MIVDVAAFVGEYAFRRLPGGDPASLAAEMAADGTTEAWVSHLGAVLWRDPTEGNALVVGHSNTVPTIIKALGGADVTVGESEYDSLFFVAPGGLTTRIRFKP